tara:strand:+ start:1025 stop:1648 length:624 start_codon:yes stop_codon:yes gene_type:complete
MRPGRALGALAAPTSIVDALFEKGNDQKEDATGMPAGKRSRGDDDSGDETWAGIVTYEMFKVLMCEKRLRELTKALPPMCDPDIAEAPCFRSLSTGNSFQTPVATGSLGGVENQRANYARYAAREPMVTAERKRVLALRASAVTTLSHYFRPNQLTDPIFQPYDLEQAFAEYQQSTSLDEGMAQMGMEEPESPASTMEPSAASGEAE